MLLMHIVFYCVVSVILNSINAVKSVCHCNHQLVWSLGAHTVKEILICEILYDCKGFFISTVKDRIEQKIQKITFYKR